MVLSIGGRFVGGAQLEICEHGPVIMMYAPSWPGAMIDCCADGRREALRGYAHT